MVRQDTHLLIQQGIKNLTTGRLDAAESALGRAVKTDPRNADALHLLGLVQNQKGNKREAVRLIRKAIKFNPKAAIYYRNLGLTYIDLEKTNDAVAALKKAIRLDHKDADSHNDLGTQYSKLGRRAEAIKEYKRAIAIEQGHHRAFNNLANDLFQSGEVEQAVVAYDKVVELQPTFAEAYFNRGKLLRELGRIDEAVSSLEKAIQLKPDYAEAYSNLGNSLKDMGRLEDALDCLNSAIEIHPGLAEAYNSRGTLFKEAGQLEEALGDYQQAIELNPDYAEPYNNGASVLKNLGRADESMDYYNRAITINPDYAEAYNNRGNLLKEIGQTEEALGDYQRAIGLKPDYTEPYYHAIMLEKSGINEALITAMEGLYYDSVGSDRKHLCFALAMAYEQIEEYDRSFDYLQEGNRIQKEVLGYSIDQDIHLFQTIKTIFDGESSYVELPKVEPTTIRPIFILGMPRSGTSLVEQILASHSKVFGAGELNTMGELVGPILSTALNQSSSHQAGLLSASEIERIQRGYLTALAGLNATEPVITDKMPLNFRWIGFILSAFPNARIVHVNREPIATCWSIYKHYFSAGGNGYGYDQSDLAQFYQLYTDLISYWHQWFPGRIYELSYEALTENQERESRKLLDYCGLEWEQRCLEFYKTKRIVKTASATQVRKKIYQGSSQVWLKYEAYLRPLIDGLS